MFGQITNCGEVNFNSQNILKVNKMVDKLMMAFFARKKIIHYEMQPSPTMYWR